MKYSEWIDKQFAKAIVGAIRANAAGKMTIDDAVKSIANANARTRRKLAWLKTHPEAENSYDAREAVDVFGEPE